MKTRCVVRMVTVLLALAARVVHAGTRQAKWKGAQWEYGQTLSETQSHVIPALMADADEEQAMQSTLEDVPDSQKVRTPA